MRRAPSLAIVFFFALGACASEEIALGDAGPDAGADAGAPVPDGGDAGTTSPQPARYFEDLLRSPVTQTVVDAVRSIHGGMAGPTDHVFMKVGASETVSDHFMRCFAGLGYDLDLDGRVALQGTIDHFLQGDAAGSTPFGRDTLAAEVGRTAAWCIAGDPSPLDAEIAAIDPRFALINYGTNDMNMGITHRSALWPFYESFMALLDQVGDRGIVPIVTGLNPRGDSSVAARWVPTYNAVIRGVSEARQIPYINLYRAVVDLPDLGLIADGLHGNAWRDGNGAHQPCVFTAPALEFNYNVRNLLTLEVLDLMRRIVIEGAPAPDPDTPGWAGSGAPNDPFVVDRLPFTHSGDTRLSPHRDIDAYPACDTGQDESGPELYFRLELADPTPLRILVLDRQGVDVDLHLTDASAAAPGCLARHDRILELTLDPGTYHLVLDTYVTGGAELSGEYLLAIVPCIEGDLDCI